MAVDPASLLGLSAVEARDRMASGALAAMDYMQACLDRIAALDGEIQAFEWIDPGFALRQAEMADGHRKSGRPIGPLHGLPVALKDVIDTRGIPTANGTAIDAGRVPERDATVVQKLRAAGALILGKTVTAELALVTPGKTRNPANPAHTPGGSSSGSAAAVATLMSPLAVGTQTGGSVIRPASFCGVTGFLPSSGSIGRTGILTQSPTLDRVGVFARSVEDAAMLAEVLFGHDEFDRLTAPAPHPRLLSVAATDAPVTPMFAFVRSPYWEQAEPACREAMEELADHLGEGCFEAELPAAFSEAAAVRSRIHLAEMSKAYHRYSRDGGELLSPRLCEALDRGAKVLAHDYIAALDWPDYLYAALGEIFQRCDAIITPAATGPAPKGLDSTGSPIFNAIWTLCGTPAITLPLFADEDGMPMGVQLVGPRGGDARLLRTARWLVRHLQTDTQGD
ncbi:glutamyl-tRNA amidotransferase [Hoeflea sp. BAL378]|uniref:amidase n=1 Tax=Hoeflea sp. BAL378 TaxID=1547437 RepID=UPI000513711D|nr:amidase [Hoeflea sp. BAL378]KGF67362.1 glutamyl-tRNA amidotransferase [Hoeflea sp. BAL378]